MSIVVLEAVLLFLVYWELNIESIDGWQALVFPPMAGGITALILGMTVGKARHE